MPESAILIADIRARFRASGMSLAEYSRRSGVGASRIIEILNGKRREVSLPVLERLAAALGCEIRLHGGAAADDCKAGYEQTTNGSDALRHRYEIIARANRDVCYSETGRRYNDALLCRNA